jgi:DNA polymerase III alpha subunit (gram-positive type)
MISLYASAHNTFSWSKNGATDLHDYHDMISSASFEKYPCYTRDDFMDYLLDDGIDRISAYEITKEISKGHANSEKTNNNSSLSKDLLHVAQNYVYVFPRAHCIESVLQYASLAYYFKADNHTFFKILQER